MFTVLAYLFWMASVGICQMGNSRVHKKPGKVNALHIVALTLFLASMLCFFVRQGRDSVEPYIDLF